MLSPSPGKYKSFEYHWTVSDFINAIVSAGCTIILTDEYGEEVCEWEDAPLHGLPANLLVISQKMASAHISAPINRY